MAVCCDDMAKLDDVLSIVEKTLRKAKKWRLRFNCPDRITGVDERGFNIRKSGLKAQIVIDVEYSE